MIAFIRSVLRPEPALSPLSGICPSPFLRRERFVFEPELMPTGLRYELEAPVSALRSPDSLRDEVICIHTERRRPMKHADALKSAIARPGRVRLAVHFHQLRKLRLHAGNRLLRVRLICDRTPGWPLRACERRAQPRNVD